MIRKAVSMPVTEVIKKGPFWAYKSFLRPYLPATGTVSYNTVLVKRQRPFDKYIPYVDISDDDDYECGLVEYIRDWVSPGDDVVVVGGGWGVSTVVAARKAGTDGHVHTFEAGKRQVKNVKKTIEENNVEDRVTVYHGAVGSTVGAFSDSNDASKISGDELPNADVLVIDCDGAEFDVLETLEDPAETVIIEHHAVGNMMGDILVEYSPEKIEELLAELGYSIESQRSSNHRFGENTHWVGLQE